MKERMFIAQNIKCTNLYLYILHILNNGLKKKIQVSNSPDVTLAKCSRLSDQPAFLGPDTGRMVVQQGCSHGQWQTG